LVLRSIPEESTRAAALKRGEVDVVYFVNGPIADDIRKTPGLTLTAMRTNGVFFLVFPEQWTQGSPVGRSAREAGASLAIDRQAINEAESLGFSAPTGNIVPRHQEFALAIPPDPYDPKRAKALLADAGFPMDSMPASSRRFLPTTRWARRSRATWLPCGSRHASGRWSAPRSSPRGATRSCGSSSSAQPGPPGNASTAHRGLRNQ
jgi:ABC-type transport system substrate-binding protein